MVNMPFICPSENHIPAWNTNLYLAGEKIKLQAKDLALHMFEICLFTIRLGKYLMICLWSPTCHAFFSELLELPSQGSDLTLGSTSAFHKPTIEWVKQRLLVISLLRLSLKMLSSVWNCFSSGFHQTPSLSPSES
jgi:hypothetical protein